MIKNLNAVSTLKRQQSFENFTKMLINISHLRRNFFFLDFFLIFSLFLEDFVQVSAAEIYQALIRFQGFKKVRTPCQSVL